MSDTRSPAADSGPIDRRTVDHIADLAGLHLEEAEAEALVADLGQIVAYVRQLEAVDTRGVPPMRHPTDEPTPLRADVVAGELDEQGALGNAPVRSGRCFSVPRVVG